jgi:hypothetical protein
MTKSLPEKEQIIPTSLSLHLCCNSGNCGGEGGVLLFEYEMFPTGSCFKHVAPSWWHYFGMFWKL